MKINLKKILFLSLSAALACACSTKRTDVHERKFEAYIDTTLAVYGPYLPVVLPITKGVKIENPIQVGVGPDGLIYAANQSGEIYSLRDTNGDGLEDSTALFCDVSKEGLRSPSSFTFKDQKLYVGTSQAIQIYEDHDRNGVADTSYVFFNQFPNSKHPYEWTTGLQFGPDGYLYFALSSDSWNAAPSPDPNGYRGALLKVSPDGKRVERLAVGLRSPYGIDFDEHGNLFFIDNEGGGNPTEELNRWVPNRFYGHNDKKYTDFDSITPPDWKLTTDVAPAGIEFNSSQNSFGHTEGNLFVAFYGPGERWERGSIGRVAIAKDQSDQSFVYNEFPVADIPKVSDLAFGSDGSLYVAQHGRSSYWYEPIPNEGNQGRFYKFIYDEHVRPRTAETRSINKTIPIDQRSVDLGKQVFARVACAGCHETDGKTELLGPNLKDVGNRLTRAEILEAIQFPSKIIKPSMMGLRVYKKDGQVLVGRVVNSDKDKLSIMLVGNVVEEIPQAEILKTENETKSLMFERLTSRLNEAEVEALLDYIISLKDHNNKF